MQAVLAFSGQVITGLIEFSAPVRSRLVAYLVLACAGAASVVLGTRCSRDARLAAGTMALVAFAFAILFAGVINSYFAAGAPPRCWPSSSP
jgi:hypothetical protein